MINRFDVESSQANAGYFIDPDPIVSSDKTVKIPVRVVKGQVEMAYGGLFPPIMDGCIAELTVPACFVSDRVVLKWLQREYSTELLPQSAEVLIAFNINRVPKDRLARTYKPKDTPVLPTQVGGFSAVFVKVLLLEPLRLTLRGSKKASLESCRCIVPALFAESGLNIADSLNHAYRLASQAFQPGCKSHTANVFLRALCQVEDHWLSLDLLRSMWERRFESCLVFVSRWNAVETALRNALGTPAGTNQGKAPINQNQVCRYLEERLSLVSSKLCDYFCSDQEHVPEMLRVSESNLGYSQGDRLKDCVRYIAGRCQGQDATAPDDLARLTCELVCGMHDYLDNGFGLDDPDDNVLLQIVNTILDIVLQSLKPGQGENEQAAG